MDTLISTYGTAITCATLLAILAAVQSFAGAALKFGPGKGQAGVPLDASQQSLPWRMERSAQNTVENLGLFTLTLLLAMLAGVSPGWVNWVSIIFVAARAGHWLMYATGIELLRTLCYATGFFATLSLAVKTLLTLL